MAMGSQWYWGGSRLLYVYGRYWVEPVQVPHPRAQRACCTADDGTIPVYRFEGSSGWLSQLR